MPGWNLREGILVTENVSDDEYWSLLNYVFSDACRKTNTYKFGLIKSIYDQIYDMYDEGTGYYISYEKLFAKFAENYWNLVNRYKLRQMSYNGKSEYSKIELILKEAVEKYESACHPTYGTGPPPLSCGQPGISKVHSPLFPRSLSCLC